MVAYSISKDSLSIVFNGKQFNYKNDHPDYDDLIKLFDSGKSESALESALSAIFNRANDFREKLSEHISIKGQHLFYDDEEITGVLSKQILQFYYEKLPVANLIAFFERVMCNPDKKVAKQLFSWIEKQGLMISPDGYFYGYKAVDKDYKSHFKDEKGRKVKYEIGKWTIKKREDCDADPNEACSRGLHVGSFDYAKGFRSHIGTSGRLLCVKVDPADVVSVPNYDTTKLRCCRLFVDSEVLASDYTNDPLQGKVAINDASKEASKNYKLVKQKPKRDEKGRFIKSEPQLRDSQGRFLPKSKIKSSRISGPQRDERGRFISSKKQSETSVKSSGLKRDGKGRFIGNKK